MNPKVPVASLAVGQRPGLRRELVWAGLLFLLSGTAALVYQVTWQRILALHSGVGIYSVAMIVASFMAGLGVGSHLGGVLSTGVTPRAALRRFALLELGIGVFAVVSAPLYYDLLYVELSWIYAVSWRAALFHFFALLLPTTLMGMSLPFLVQAMVRKETTAGRTIGYLYGINVVGAAIGAFITPWFLIRHFGIDVAILWGAGANLLVAMGALGLGSRLSAPHSRLASAARAPATESSRTSFVLWMVLYSLSGFCALSLEIVWFRVIDVAVRGTAFTFGTVLSIFLLGLAGGSLLGAGTVARLRHPLRVFLLCQCVILGYAAVGLILLAALPTDVPLYRWLFSLWQLDQALLLGRDWDPWVFGGLYALLPTAIYGLPTLLMGYSFPVLQRAVQDDPATSGRKVGFLQAANIAGNVAGSLVVGLFALSLLGTTGTIRGLLACGLVFAGVGIRYYGLRGSFGAATVVFAVLFVVLPDQKSLWRRLHGVDGGPTMIVEDATSVVALRPEEGSWRVHVNGRRHSWIPFGGLHSLLGAIPVLMHPEPREVAVIGLGSGDTAWAATSRSETRNAVVFEIARPQLMLLRRYVDSYGDRNISKLLGDDRMRIEIADGRRALLSGERRYDVIVVDALRPTSAYSGNLNSMEFFADAAEQLRPRGLMCIWAPTLRIRSAFLSVFSHSVGFRRGNILVGSRSPIEITPRVWRKRLLSASEHLGPSVTRQVRRPLAKAEPGTRFMPQGVVPNRDLFPRDEFLTPQ